MQNLLLAFNVVAPLMIYMLIGASLRKANVVDERILRGANNIIYYVTLPLMCYRAVAVSDLNTMFDTPFLLYMAIGILAIYALTALIVPVFCKENRRRGVMMLGIFRSNDAIFGLAVAAALLGEDNLGLMSIGVSLCVPLYSILSVVAMERYRGERVRFGKVLLRVLLNPIILGCIAGFTVNFFNITLPAVLQKPIDGLAAVTSPLAFVLLGGTISFAAVQKNRAAITVVSLLRLLIIPLVVVGSFLLLGFRGEFIVVTLIIFGAPVAMVTYTMAVGMGADDELAGALVAVSSVLSIVTMFLFIFVLKQFAFI
ncbi:MAG: AEC family transporter [Eubacteriales bacterium]|jgi:predicted permease|nr:AEC family transporter [Eubacteriales bacterium]